LSNDVIEDDAEVEPDDNGGVTLSWDEGGGRSITKSGANRLRVKIADWVLEFCTEIGACGWMALTTNGTSVLLVELARFCHFSRFCWNIVNG
jgi:hypothetical protein